MCRIAAIIGDENNLESQIQSMTNAMHRGGPDDSGLSSKLRIKLCFRS